MTTRSFVKVCQMLMIALTLYAMIALTIIALYAMYLWNYHPMLAMLPQTQRAHLVSAACTKLIVESAVIAFFLHVMQAFDAVFGEQEQFE